MVHWIAFSYPRRRAHIMESINEYGSHARLVLLKSKQQVRIYAQA